MNKVFKKTETPEQKRLRLKHIDAWVKLKDKSPYNYMFENFIMDKENNK